ncbi:hypothetical protein [Mesoflavibacter zeaxanthinifaciens]|uniref:hypothetical protein n=1 Tax=Mesoflavibacter zeaxanthinifaciens TaxID=393060 RepID=UPI00041CB884|nr:hypothetical protein [Mesoflavibacter zeaxanthinifaciens]
MDELELLKKDWQKNNNTFEKKSSSDLYAMLHKKSSSLVKKLFYISIAELIFLISVNVLPFVFSKSYRQHFNKVYNDSLLNQSIEVLSYVVIILFVILLFRSYKSITVVDDTKKLMKSILRTRKIVKYYVLYNLTFIVILVPYFMYKAIKTNSSEIDLEHLTNFQILKLIGGIFLFTLLFAGVVWFIYNLIYGIILRRLNRNYKELKKMEV